MGILGFAACMRALFPTLEREKVWDVAQRDAMIGGDAVDKWVESKPIDQRPTRLLGMLPGVNAAGTLLVIFGPRVLYTMLSMRAPKERSPSQKYLAPTPPEQVELQTPTAVTQPAPERGDEPTITGGGYADLPPDYADELGAGIE